MRILVTGGAGFIGSAIVDQLVDGGHDVIVLDNLLAGAHRAKPDYLNDRAQYEWRDIRDGEAVDDAVRGVDAVCHQAAMVGLGVDFSDAPDYVAHNDLGTATLLRSLHWVGFGGRLVLASSMVVYGEGAYRCDEHGPVRPAPRRPQRLESGRYEPTCPLCDLELAAVAISEDAAVDPRNVYAATKLHQEHLANTFGREHDSLVVALRYHNVYGPRMPRDTPYAGVAAIFRSSAERGQPPRLFEDGGQRRDFVHVHDVARANVLALTSTSAVRGAFNVATGEPHTVGEMATALSDAIGGPPPQIVGGHRLGDVRHVFASPERTKAELGFSATVGFAEGIRAFATDPLRT